MLIVSNIVVDHGKLRALWDVSLTVAAGERVGVLGANGAGKSTTLGAIAGLYPVCGGTITFDDAPVGGRPPSENVGRGIALVPEGRRLFPEMTVRENLEMGAYLKESRRKLSHNLERVFGLFPILRQKSSQNAGELSGGQQQMVAIGRALMSDPKLMLLDEPFLGVAPLVIAEVLDALRRISEEGLAIVLVEQNVQRAFDFVERAYLIENGRTVLEGDKQALIEDPEFTRKFLGIE